MDFVGRMSAFCLRAERGGERLRSGELGGNVCVPAFENAVRWLVGRQLRRGREGRQR